jgi:mono/diheme cytochrome c family protein
MKPKYLFLVSTALAIVFYACSGGSSSSTQTGNTPQSSNASTANEGQDLFEAKCAVCHGSDGTAGIGNAADLNISRLDSAATKQMITNGKNTMPSFGSQLSVDELDKLVSYVHTLRQ